MTNRKITDIEEKKLQLGYFISRHKGTTRKFRIRCIFNQWMKWWEDDFKIDGIKLQLYDNKIVLSAKGVKMGVEQPQFLDYYTGVLEYVNRSLLEEYNINVNGKQNSNKFKMQMFKLRKKNFEKLKTVLKCEKLEDKYYIINKTKDKHPCCLGRYVVHDKNETDNRKYCFSGTYEQVKNYIYSELVNREV